MPVLEQSTTPYTLTTAYAPSGELQVLSFDGEEAMNGLYSFVVVAWGRYLDEGEVTGAVLGRPATLLMHLGDGATRPVHGVVSRVGFEAQHEAE